MNFSRLARARDHFQPSNVFLFDKGTPELCARFFVVGRVPALASSSAVQLPVISLLPGTHIKSCIAFNREFFQVTLTFYIVVVWLHYIELMAVWLS